MWSQYERPICRAVLLDSYLQHTIMNYVRTLVSRAVSVWQVLARVESIQPSKLDQDHFLPPQQFRQSVTGCLGLLKCQSEHMILALEMLHVTADLLNLNLELFALAGKVLLCCRRLRSWNGRGVQGWTLRRLWSMIRRCAWPTNHSSSRLKQMNCYSNDLITQVETCFMG